ncbi:MAG: exosortase-associated protein EpsI, V-type [Sphingomicrobium sp.]
MSAEFPPDRTRLLSRREIVAGLAMLSEAGIAAARKPDIKLNYLGDHKLEKILPTTIGRWKFVTTSGLVVPPADQQLLTLYSQLLTRVYYDGSTQIMLLIAYSASETGFIQVHRPEFCYTAAGFTLSDFAPHDVQVSPERSIRVNTMTAMRDGGGEKLLYWVRIGEHIPLSWAEQKIVFAEDNLRRLIPDAALIRVSTPIGDEAKSMANIDNFVRAMLEAIAPPLRRVLIG